MNIQDLLRKNQSQHVISGNTALFSHVYLTPYLPNTGVLWFVVDNDYQIKRGNDLLIWWLKINNIKSKNIITWLSNQELNTAQLYQIINQSECIVVTTAENLSKKIIQPKALQAKLIKLSTNDQIDPYQLRTDLINTGYEINSLADQPGLLAARGFVLDIWPINQAQPLRLEFDNNKLIKINYYKQLDKTIGSAINSCQIVPLYIKPQKLQTLHSLISGQHFLLTTQKLFNDYKLDKFEFAQQFLLNDFSVGNDYKIFSSPTKFNSNFDRFKQAIDDWQKHGYKINIITQHSDRIKELTVDKKISNLKIHTLKSFSFNGLIDEMGKQIWLNDIDIFKAEITPKIKNEFIADIKVGDYIVHRDHGIAKLTAMTWQTVDHTEREYFVLTYGADDKLYLPVEQADKISKYLGVGKPKLHRLGAASTWPQTIRKLKQDIIKTAQELLNLYARRQLSVATPLLPHDKEEKKLADDFVYEETPDQLQALTETLDDLTKNTPTDRLVCGDVGFGKTEIALRAAWRTVLNNKQVIILCPTTILAQQHYDTFSQRFAGYPVEIGLLSRFVSSKDQQTTIKNIKKGNTNIIIGTHRLLSKDIKFNNIGLIIIDEEQQFGVKDKEKLKELKTSAHILSLSATPIPRTLNLALSGLRDISTIATAPEGRIPIQTFIKPFAEDIIKQAIDSEIKRQGQVYYLYNKVETINGQMAYLKKLLPKYSYGIVHGQLSPNQIATVMHQFDEGKIDVLICSTIIANGLDLPNVNTLIVDGAQNFGLAQLYQIRGRIGRSNKQAYAYFLYHSLQLKGLAAKRLQALQEAVELGAGFQIAMRDMEIRGVGSILGKQQHGKASLVGLTIYNELVSQTIAEIKTGIIPKALIDTTIDLPLTTGLPTNFLTDEISRLRYYQLLTNCQTIDDLNKQFKKLPKPWPSAVQNLQYILELKLLARHVDILSIDAKYDSLNKAKIYIDFVDELDYKKVKELLEKNDNWEFKNNQLKIEKEKLGKDWQSELKHTIELFIKQ